MPSNPVEYKVMIAAPSDLSREVEIAQEIMHRYRRRDGEDSIRLDPWHWKSDAVSSIHLAGQDAINDQIADFDMIVAMFWTRRGEPTGGEESGTEVEIALFKAAGKPGTVMFNRAGPKMGSVPLAELQRIEDLRKKAHGKFLTVDFVGEAEFREKLLHNLNANIDDLRKRKTKEKQKVDDKAQRQRAEAERQQFEADVVADRFLKFRAKRHIIAVSMIPAEPLTPHLTLGSGLRDKYRQVLAPLRTRLGHGGFTGTSLYYSEVYLNDFRRESETSVLATTQLTDTGSIFAVENMGWYSQDEPEDFDPKKTPGYRMNVYQAGIVEGVKRYAQVLREIGISVNLHIGVSILKFPKTRITMYDQIGSFGSGQGIVYGGGDVHTRTIVVPINDLVLFEQVRDALEPAFRHFWHAIGSPEVPLYDEEGKFLSFIRE